MIKVDTENDGDSYTIRRTFKNRVTAQGYDHLERSSGRIDNGINPHHFQ